MPKGARTWLLILTDRNALAWVLREERMAFTAHRAKAAGRLKIGDRLLLYTTRGCFRNPTRDRGRVMGIARVASTVHDLDSPVELMDRKFTVGCSLEVLRLAPLRSGVEVAPLVSQLTVFPNPRAWSGRMRQPLLELPNPDAQFLETRLGAFLQEPREVLHGYVSAASAEALPP